MRNGVQEKKRSFFVVVGDRAKDAIVHRKSSWLLFGSPPSNMHSLGGHLPEDKTCC